MPASCRAVAGWGGAAASGAGQSRFPEERTLCAVVLLLMQVLWHTSMIDLIEELLVNGAGNELYILDAEQLGFRVGERVQFGEVVEAGKLLQMSVLGYARTGGLKPVLGPAAEEVVEFKAGYKVVVVADLVVGLIT